jgi:hypothetical protein
MDWGLGNWVVMQGGCAGASLKECSSVHRHSKQQRAALLKLKIENKRLKWRRVYHRRLREPERLAALLWIDRWAVGML